LCEIAQSRIANINADLRNFLAKTGLSRLHGGPEYDMITCKDMLFIVESSVKGIFFNSGALKPPPERPAKFCQEGKAKK
jgi:hypothetical protein